MHGAFSTFIKSSMFIVYYLKTMKTFMLTELKIVFVDLWIAHFLQCTNSSSFHPSTLFYNAGVAFAPVCVTSCKSIWVDHIYFPVEGALKTSFKKPFVCFPWTVCIKTCYLEISINFIILTAKYFVNTLFYFSNNWVKCAMNFIQMIFKLFGIFPLGFAWLRVELLFWSNCANSSTMCSILKHYFLKPLSCYSY